MADDYEYDSNFAYREVVYRAWSDNEFKLNLLKNPINVLKEFNVALPSNIKEVEIVENTENKIYLVLPNEPEFGDLSEDEIKELLDSMLLTQFVFPSVLDC